MPKFSVEKFISKYGLQGGREALTPYALENTDISARDLRKLYTELRDIANKRIKRANKAGYGQNLVIRQGAKKIPKISEIRTDAELRYRIGETAMFWKTLFPQFRESSGSRLKSSRHWRAMVTIS